MEGPYAFKHFTGTFEAGDWEVIPRGHWARLETGSVFVCCPQCGKVARLPHQVFASGGVTPSLVCPFTTKEMVDPPCTMHLSPVYLLDWTFGDKPKN